MQKFNRIIITPKKKQDLMTVKYNRKAVLKDGTPFKERTATERDLPMHRELQYAIEALVPHLLWSTELIDEKINLDAKMDYEKWFSESLYAEDSRFNNVTITGITFYGTEALDAVKLHGFKETIKTAKPFRVKIESPVINLDRVAENQYALVKILDEQIDTVLIEIEKWLSVPEGQLSISYNNKDEEAA